jgi:hypothetical protein
MILKKEHPENIQEVLYTFMMYLAIFIALSLVVVSFVRLGF